MVIKAHLDPAPSVLDERREPRRALHIETSGVLPSGLEANVTVLNLSTTGLLIETDVPLETGEMLEIDLPEIGPVEAEIMWQSDRLSGCAFADSLPKSALATVDLQALPASSPSHIPHSPGEPFGTRLNRLRRERGLTLAQVAASLDVSKPTVWAWEKGKARPLPERIEAIAEVLGVSVEDLSESREGDAGRSVVEDCRLRIATAYATSPQNIRIMVEV
ncbi:helix-turn-helix domain-containing protein [Erythrobacter sp. GH1-10]|uniref:helix-turn-helix domain-containing protein n=1 Tax=Erythrobacter sp. GH1-10 TaxID=3349334 RepID=UPI0038783103